MDLDVSRFFDSVRWDLALKAVGRHTDSKWILLYVERWLKAPMRIPDGAVTVRTQGAPQGGPISPLLANIFLHYGMDVWLSREYPGCRFERFADDAVIHCVTERQALEVKERLGVRFAGIGLLLHPNKTKIAYCLDGSTRSRPSRSAGMSSVPGKPSTRGGRKDTRTSCPRRLRRRSRRWGGGSARGKSPGART